MERLAVRPGWILIAVALAFAQCQLEQEVPFARVSGVVRNTEADSVRLGEQDFQIHEGRFEAEIQLKGPRLLYLILEDEIPIYLRPGSHVQLVVDAADPLGTAEWTGSHVSEHRFMTALTREAH